MLEINKQSGGEVRLKDLNGPNFSFSHQIAPLNPPDNRSSHFDLHLEEILWQFARVPYLKLPPRLHLWLKQWAHRHLHGWWLCFLFQLWFFIRLRFFLRLRVVRFNETEDLVGYKWCVFFQWDKWIQRFINGSVGCEPVCLYVNLLMSIIIF